MNKQSRFSTPDACIELWSHACFLSLLSVLLWSVLCSCLHISSFCLSVPPLVPPSILASRSSLRGPSSSPSSPLSTSCGISAPLPAFSQMSSCISQWPTEPSFPLRSLLYLCMPGNRCKHTCRHVHLHTSKQTQTQLGRKHKTRRIRFLAMGNSVKSLKVFTKKVRLPLRVFLGCAPPESPACLSHSCAHDLTNSYVPRPVLTDRCTLAFH